MFEGQIFVDFYDIGTGEITRVNKSFELPFQPYAGMDINTGIDTYTISIVEWSLEYMSFTAWVYVSDLEISDVQLIGFRTRDWEFNTFDPIKGYEEKFLKRYRGPASSVVDCDVCAGSGDGGPRETMLGLVGTSTCDRCGGHGKIILEP